MDKFCGIKNGDFRQRFDETIKNGDFRQRFDE
jgi:hypothetical protein